MTPCHAGASHSAATDRNHFGWLCEPCWSWCQRLIARLTNKERSK